MSGIEITAVRRGNTLIPASPIFVEDIAAIPEGKEVFVTVKMVRSAAQHRWFHAMLKQIVESGSWEGDVESLLDYIKIGTGHVSTVVDPNLSGLIPENVVRLAEKLKLERGADIEINQLCNAVLDLNKPRTFFVLKSISFKSMDGTKFKQFLALVERFLAKKMGIDIDQLRMRTADTAGGPVGEAAPEKEPEPEQLAAPATTPPLKGEGEVRELPIGDRLAQFSMDLTTREMLADFEAKWAEVKSLPATKALYKEEPEAVQAIANAARNLVSGKFPTRERYDAVVNAAIVRVMDRRGE